MIKMLFPIQNLMLKSLTSFFWSSNEPTTCYIKSIHDPPHFFLSRFFELPVESTGGRRRRLLAQFCDNTNKLVPWCEKFHHEKPGILKVAKKNQNELCAWSIFTWIYHHFGGTLFLYVLSDLKMKCLVLLLLPVTSQLLPLEVNMLLNFDDYSLKLTAKAPYQISRAPKRKGSYSNHWNLQGF